MSEELRVLLRNALYMASAVVVYWFVAYEWAGTVMMAVLVLAAGAFVLIMSRIVRATTREAVNRQEESGARQLVSVPLRVFGFEEHGGEAHATPMSVDEGQMPHGSIWPFICVVGIVLITAGFIFGLWFLILGGLIAAWGMWGWITQIAPSAPTIPVSRAEEPGAFAPTEEFRGEEPGPDGRPTPHEV